MQATCLTTTGLIYAAAVLQAFRMLPGAEMLKVQRTVLFPGAFLLVSFLLARFVPPVRSFMERHLWLSFRTGFGQTPISVLGGLGVLIALAGFIFWQVAQASHGGRYPGGAFSGYAAGIGLLCAQTLLVRRMERDPALSEGIEAE